MPKRKAIPSVYCHAESVKTEPEESLVETPPRVNQPTATLEPTVGGALEGDPVNQTSHEVGDVANTGELELGPLWEMLKLAGYEVW